MLYLYASAMKVRSNNNYRTEKYFRARTRQLDIHYFDRTEMCDIGVGVRKPRANARTGKQRPTLPGAYLAALVDELLKARGACGALADLDDMPITESNIALQKICRHSSCQRAKKKSKKNGILKFPFISS